MSLVERRILFEAVKKIPCALSAATFDNAKNGSAWLGCKECPRCVLLRALNDADWKEHIDHFMKEMPENGGYQLREDLRTTSDSSKDAKE